MKSNSVERSSQSNGGLVLSVVDELREEASKLIVKRRRISDRLADLVREERALRLALEETDRFISTLNVAASIMQARTHE